MDCSPPGLSVHEVLWARTLELIASPFPKGSSQPSDRTQVSCIAVRFLTIWATREAHVIWIATTTTIRYSYTSMVRCTWVLSCCFCCSVAKSYLTLCDPVDYCTPGFPVFHHLLEFAQTRVFELVMPPNHLILCHPLLLLPSVFLSIRVFSNESTLHIRWPKYWSSNNII